MAWNIKKLFGRGKPKEEAPAPAAPAPTAPPEAKKPGRFRRLADKLKRKPKGEAPAPTPPAPPAPPKAPPPAPPAPPAPAAPSEGEYPSSIDVEADGDWIISSTEWSGRMQGTIRGNKAKEFIQEYEKGNWSRCAQMVADHWDVNVADQLVPEESNIDYINWS
ncbi:hypothetical protein ACFWDI_40400 [Streptomyces sp. NPDC060064]|uniref:hypothetical protein n=1 Tax=Streptomyces sp. NPDC060064 TaxID=3347049 RepID=UPI0036C76090